MFKSNLNPENDYDDTKILKAVKTVDKEKGAQKKKESGEEIIMVILVSPCEI